MAAGAATIGRGAGRISRRLDRLSERKFALLVSIPGLLLLAAIVAPPILSVFGLSLFRIELAVGAPGDLKHVRVGNVEIAALTDKSGPAILAVPPTDILVSREPLTSSARNVFCGRVTRLVHQRGGAVHVTADVGVELVAVVTEDAARDLGLTPGSPVAFAFKASAVRVF